MRTALAVAVGLVAAVSMVPAADAKAPEACSTLTQADVDAALGAGFTPLPQARGGSDYSACGYQKGRDTAAVTILGAPGGNGVEANTGREERQRAAGHAITPLPGLCDRAFLANLGPTASILMAAKGAWQVDVQVTISGKSSPEAARKLARSVCGRLR